MRKAFATCILSGILASAAPDPLTEARRLYQHTRYRAALQLLLPVEARDGAYYFLLGRIYYGQGDFKAATKALERAVAAEPRNPAYWHWLGKAYGRRAETSIFFRAPAYARKCHQAFEKAVQLDPENLEAINDLFSYYLDAPGWLGGGLRKAEALAERIGRLDEAEYQYAEAQLAKKRKQYAAAERHLRRAVELEPGDVGRRIDLAEFLADRGRLQESDEVFERAREIAPDSPKLWFAMARTYIKEKRRPAEARRLLEQYLAAELTPEDPPRAEARRLLDKVKGG